MHYTTMSNQENFPQFHYVKTMPFQEFERVIYNKNPLDNVVCQLKFSPILKIDSETPSQFQEAIRNIYPRFEAKEGAEIQMPKELVKLMPRELLSAMLSPVSGKNYSFMTRDRSWRVSLTRDFLALSTTKYQRWEDFKERLRVPLEALNQIYSPAFFTRVGLRYQNVIVRSRLGIQNRPWSDLIQPFISGVLNEPPISESVITTESKIEIQLEDNQSIVRVFHGFVGSVKNNEICYQLDSDFFTEQEVEVNDVIDKLDYFNQRSGRLFRWFITESLHNAMGPTPIA